MVHPFWSSGNDTATATANSTADIDIARQFAEKDLEIQNLSHQLAAQQKAQVHNNTKRRTSPILWRLYLACLLNSTVKTTQCPAHNLKQRLPSWCHKNLSYRCPQLNRRVLAKMILVRTTKFKQKGALVKFQTLSLQLLHQARPIDESKPTHGLCLSKTELKSSISKHVWDLMTNRPTMISGYIVRVSN